MSTNQTERAKITALWGALRVVVLDVETTSTPDGGPQRIVSIGAVTCRGGTVRGKWQTLVNPEVPVAPGSRRIHGITDEHLVGEPVFSEVATVIRSMLTENDGERLVLAAHNVPFDVSVLRHEFRLLGLDLPDVCTIDTMGPLAGLVGVRPEDRTLRGLLRALDLTNAREHDALADATACAEALVELLNRAAQQGHTDLDELLARIEAGSTHAVRAGVTIADDDAPALMLPEQHVETHTTVLSRRAGQKMLAVWRQQVQECAMLRCRHLDDRVQAAQPPADTLRAELETVLEHCAEQGDTAGAATVLKALVPLLSDLPVRNIRNAKRVAALEWVATWADALNSLGRCEGKDLCPACRRMEPCALDTWFEPLAELALDDASNIRSILETNGRNAGHGSYEKWIADGIDRRFADATLWECVLHWRNVGQDVRAQQLITFAWRAGCRHPDIADAYAGQVAAAGRPSDLQAGVAVCDKALASRAGSTHEGWTRLLSRRNQLQGRVERANVRYADILDEDGNPVPLRRHHPEWPRRTRPTRFVGK